MSLPGVLLLTGLSGVGVFVATATTVHLVRAARQHGKHASHPCDDADADANANANADDAFAQLPDHELTVHEPLLSKSPRNDHALAARLSNRLPLVLPSEHVTTSALLSETESTPSETSAVTTSEGDASDRPTSPSPDAAPPMDTASDTHEVPPGPEAEDELDEIAAAPPADSADAMMAALSPDTLFADAEEPRALRDRPLSLGASAWMASVLHADPEDEASEDDSPATVGALATPRSHDVNAGGPLVVDRTPVVSPPAGQSVAALSAHSESDAGRVDPPGDSVSEEASESFGMSSESADAADLDDLPDLNKQVPVAVRSDPVPVTVCSDPVPVAVCSDPVPVVVRSNPVPVVEGSKVESRNQVSTDSAMSDLTSDGTDHKIEIQTSTVSTTASSSSATVEKRPDRQSNGRRPPTKMIRSELQGRAKPKRSESVLNMLSLRRKSSTGVRDGREIVRAAASGSGASDRGKRRDNHSEAGRRRQATVVRRSVEDAIQSNRRNSTTVLSVRENRLSFRRNSTTALRAPDISVAKGASKDGLDGLLGKSSTASSTDRSSRFSKRLASFRTRIKSRFSGSQKRQTDSAVESPAVSSNTISAVSVVSSSS